MYVRTLKHFAEHLTNELGSTQTRGLQHSKPILGRRATVKCRLPESTFSKLPNAYSIEGFYIYIFLNCEPTVQAQTSSSDVLICNHAPVLTTALRRHFSSNSSSCSISISCCCWYFCSPSSSTGVCGDAMLAIASTRPANRRKCWLKRRT